jgi:signal transduction histidine kinase
MELPILSSAAGTTSTLTPYILLSLLPSIIAAELALYGWQRRQLTAAMPFILLMAAVCFWSVCHTLSVASATLAPTLFWAQLQYGGIVLVAPLWLLFALDYHGAATPIQPAQRYVLLAPALVSYAAVLSNEAHHLWWPTVALDLSRPFGSLQITRGLLFWLHFAYSYGCIGLGFAVILHRMRITAPFQRRQARLVALGALFPLAGNLAHVLGMRTTVIDDPTPFLFVGTGLVIVYAALHYQFPDPTPVAAGTLCAQFPDGVVVLDHSGIVTSLTAPVPRFLSLVRNSRTWIGRSFQQSIAGSPLEPELRKLLASPDVDRAQQIAYHGTEGMRTIEVRLRPLYAEATRAGALLLVRNAIDHGPAAREQRSRELEAIRRLSQATQIGAEIDEIIQAISREITQLVPGDRAVIGLFDPGKATVQLAGEQAFTIHVALIEPILHSKQPHLSDIADPWLAGTALQTRLAQDMVRIIFIIPLVHDDAPLGALLIGATEAWHITPDTIHLFATIGTLVAAAIERQRRSEQDQEGHRDTLSFFAATTHELRTPLTALLGFTDLLDRGIYGDLPERVHEPLLAMRRNGQTLLRLINDILDMAKLKAGRFTIECAPVDITTVIHDVVSAIEPLAYERGLVVALDLAQDVPLAYGQRERLSQVLTNLLSNAIKFTDHGSITVRTAHEGQRVRFSVMDTGVGIAPEQQQAIFEEFEQLVNAHQDYSPGTGLGLSISRRLMELMGGALTVESTPGVGSTFSGSLLIAQEPLQTKAYGAPLQ